MRALPILFMTIFAAACASDAGNTGDTTATTTTAAARTTDTVTAAATISNAIAANPAAADSILRANGHTPESFERLLYDIAADSAMSSRYAAAKTSR